jgi:hypothetical protein
MSIEHQKLNKETLKIKQSEVFSPEFEMNENLLKWLEKSGLFDSESGKVVWMIDNTGKSKDGLVVKPLFHVHLLKIAKINDNLDRISFIDHEEILAGNKEVNGDSSTYIIYNNKEKSFSVESIGNRRHEVLTITNKLDAENVLDRLVSDIARSNMLIEGVIGSDKDIQKYLYKWKKEFKEKYSSPDLK